MILLLAERNDYFANLIYNMCKEQNVPCTYINENQFVNYVIFDDLITSEEYNIKWKVGEKWLDFNSISGILNLFKKITFSVQGNIDNYNFLYEQYISYLSFCLGSHSNVFNKPINGNINSNLFSMVYFWQYLSIRNLNTPKWGFSKKFINGLKKSEFINLIGTNNIFDFNNWNINSKYDKHLVYYVRPKGNHILVAFIDDFFIFSVNVEINKNIVMKILIELKILGINFGELLLFHGKNDITFGRYSPSPEYTSYPKESLLAFTKKTINKLLNVNK